MYILLSFFQWVLISSITASVLAIIILMLKLLLKDTFGVRWHYFIWILVVIRLLVPFAPQSSFSIFNIFSITNNISSQSLQNTVPKFYIPIQAPKINDNTTTTQNNPSSNNTPLLKTSYAVSHTNVLIMVFSLIWFFGTFMTGLYLLVNTLQFWRKLRFQKSYCMDEKILGIISNCKSEMKITTKVETIISDLVKTPAVFGIIRPKLLFPIGLINQLTQDELKHIILHEFAHLKRKDLLLNFIISLLQVIHWFNPILWYSFRHMREDAEIACDALALCHVTPTDCNKYGQTIVNLIDNIPRQNSAYGMAGIIGHKAQIKRRITMVSKFRRSTYRLSGLSIIVLLVMGCVLLTNAQGLAVTDNKSTLASNSINFSVDNAQLNEINPSEENQNNSNTNIIKKNNTTIEYKKIISTYVGKETTTLEYWKDRSNLMEKTMTRDGEGNPFQVSILKDNGKRWIEIDYIDGKATEGRTWTMPNKISKENSRLLSLSIFETDKDEYTKVPWKIDNNVSKLNGKNVKKVVALDLKKNRKDIVYLDKATGLPMQWDTYENEELLFKRTIEYKKYLGDPEELFNCKNIELKELDPQLKDEIGVG